MKCMLLCGNAMKNTNSTNAQHAVSIPVSTVNVMSFERMDLVFRNLALELARSSFKERIKDQIILEEEGAYNVNHGSGDNHVAEGTASQPDLNVDGQIV